MPFFSPSPASPACGLISDGVQEPEEHCSWERSSGGTTTLLWHCPDARASFAGLFRSWWAPAEPPAPHLCLWSAQGEGKGKVRSSGLGRLKKGSWASHVWSLLLTWVYGSTKQGEDRCLRIEVGNGFSPTAQMHEITAIVLAGLIFRAKTACFLLSHWGKEAVWSNASPSFPAYPTSTFSALRHLFNYSTHSLDTYISHLSSRSQGSMHRTSTSRFSLQ